MRGSMGQIADLQKKVMKNKIAKGFNTTDVQMEFLLTHGELAEAYEAWLKKKDDLGEELADILIYLMGLAGVLGIDLEKELLSKMEKNKLRKYVKKNGVLVKEDE
jgi:NTP pyrophosphatase (non-canonical NTP hydrolase)